MVEKLLFLAILFSTNNLFENSRVSLSDIFFSSTKVKFLPIVEELKPFEKKLNKNFFNLWKKNFYSCFKLTFVQLLRFKVIKISQLYEEEITYEYEDLENIDQSGAVPSFDLEKIELNIFTDYLLRILKKIEVICPEFDFFQKKIVIPGLEVFEILYKHEPFSIENEVFMQSWRESFYKFLENGVEQKYLEKIKENNILGKIFKWRELGGCKEKIFELYFKKIEEAFTRI